MLPVYLGFQWIHPPGMRASLASYTRALGLVSWVSFSLKSRLHCLFQQNSYCQGVQCACFSKDDKYVYAGLRDRSIIVWSVLDGESFCFESKANLRPGEEGPVLGPGYYSAPLWPPLAGSLPVLYHPRRQAHLELQCLF